MNEEMKRYLLEEENHPFTGWDFSYLDGRWESDKLPWSYTTIVKSYLKKTSKIIDIGTGGGEFLLSLNHSFNLTDVTEAYEPNIAICLNKLKPLGINVYPLKDDDILTDVPSNYYDIALNRHESFNEKEINRILKKGGLFITEQVGAYNNKDLATFFDEFHQDQFPQVTLDKMVKKLINNGFVILCQNEAFPKLKFYDLGAVAYFAKIISWEFLNFSVKDHFDEFDVLNELLKTNGFISSTEHRFLIVAIKQ